jgi:hypothetical protein
VSSRFTVGEGEVVAFHLRYRPSFSGAAPAGLAEDPVGEALAAWRSWTALHQNYGGRYGEQVRRSALVLQGLTYQPSGVVVAAATTSLPEEIGGQLNWDYRFAWLRDASLTMQSLWVAACPDEPERFFTWLPQAMGEFGDEGVQIMYGIEGERDLSERTLEHLGVTATAGPCGWATTPGNRSSSTCSVRCSTPPNCCAISSANPTRSPGGSSSNSPTGPPPRGGSRMRGCGRAVTGPVTTPPRRSCAGSRSTGRPAWPSGSAVPTAGTTGGRRRRRSVPPCSRRHGATKPARSAARSARTDWMPRCCCCRWSASSRRPTNGWPPRSRPSPSSSVPTVR